VGRVAAIHLRLGPLAGVVKEALLSAYGLAREGTLLAAAELVVEEVPLVGYCPNLRRQSRTEAAHAPLPRVRFPDP